MASTCVVTVEPGNSASDRRQDGAITATCGDETTNAGQSQLCAEHSVLDRMAGRLRRVTDR
jgi:hypothetical protein